VRHPALPHPRVVLTHHHRPSFTLADTKFHFLDATPTDALQRATDAADGKDVRLGGRRRHHSAVLEADLVDTIHVAVARSRSGRGERLWTSTRLLDRFTSIGASPSGVTHLLFWRR